MDKDRLEQFIHQNREQFDDALPSLKVWAEIERAMQPERARPKVSWLRVLAFAASVSLLVLSGVGIGLYMGKSAGQDTPIALSEIDPSYAGLEEYYQREISSRMAKLANYQQGSAVREDLQQLDHVLLELQEELKQAPKGQEAQIIENMIRSYKAKVDILERVLNRLQETKNGSTSLEKTNSHEISI